MSKEKLLNYLEEFISEERKNRFLNILEHRTNFITVVTEDVYHMHNASAVVRSCEAFGIQQAHLVEGKFGKKLDSEIAMGAQKWVDIKRHQTATDAMQHLRAEGYKIVATSPHEDSSLLQDFILDAKTAVFFGTESTGLSNDVLHNADDFIKIPMVGFTESLNISVAAAIILQHLTHILKTSEMEWGLTPSQILDKRLDWTKKSIKSVDEIIERYGQNH